MQLVNHKIEGISFKAAHYTGGLIVPSIVILHDTAGRLEKGNSAAYLASKNTGTASVHFVIERDGSVQQQVPTNRRANHAGQSSFHGRNSCNEFSIGIEIVNPGLMQPVAGQPDKGRAWWGEVIEGAVRVKTPQHGAGMWLPYTAEQIEVVIALLDALFQGIPTLTDITTHWYVSPGRKIDTNPLFPLEQVRAHILGRDDPAIAEAEAFSDEEPTYLMLRIATSGSSLNMRRWPSFNPNVIGSIPNGTLVPALRSGVFDGRSWSLVRFDGLEGWIVNSYTQPG